MRKHIWALVLIMGLLGPAMGLLLDIPPFDPDNVELVFGKILVESTIEDGAILSFDSLRLTTHYTTPTTGDTLYPFISSNPEHPDTFFTVYTDSGYMYVGRVDTTHGAGTSSHRAWISKIFGVRIADQPEICIILETWTNTLMTLISTDTTFYNLNDEFSLRIYYCGAECYNSFRVQCADTSVQVWTGIYLGVEDVEINMPEEISLTAYPNPFNSAVKIRVRGVEDSRGRVEIFDINGRNVAQLPVGAGSKPARAGGSRTLPYEITWQPDESLGSGVYLVRAKIEDGQTATRRVVYLK